MKIYPKNDLKMKDGLIVTEDGSVVNIDSEIVDLANNLETNLQKVRFLAKQPMATPFPSLEDFKRKTIDSIELFAQPKTPEIDAQAKRTLAIMNEADDVKLTNEMNNMLEGLKPLILFTRDTDVISMDVATVRRFDTPFLGDPLKWTIDTIYKAVSEINGRTTENGKSKSNDE